MFWGLAGGKWFGLRGLEEFVHSFYVFFVPTIWIVWAVMMLMCPAHVTSALPKVALGVIDTQALPGGLGIEPRRHL